MLGTEGGPHWAPYVTVSMEPVNACNFLRNKHIWKRTSLLCFSSHSSSKTRITLSLPIKNVPPESNMAAYKMAAVNFTPPNDFPLCLIRSHMVVIHLFLMICDLQRVVRDLCPTLYITYPLHAHYTTHLFQLHWSNYINIMNSSNNKPHYIFFCVLLLLTPSVSQKFSW